MAPSQAVRRVKNKRITRQIIIGSEAINLPPVGDPARPKGIDNSHKKAWTVYVRELPGDPDMTFWIEKISFKLHESYKDSSGGMLRWSENRPFEVRETGWGGFLVDIRFFFRKESGEKPAVRQHWLQLEPYGNDTDKAEQTRTGRVVSETLEIIEFNEPTEPLYELLTSDEQFKYLTPPRGKGKGGRPTFPAYDPSDLGVGLPDKASKENEFSKEREDVVHDEMMQALAEVEKQTKAGLAKKEELEKLMKEYGETGDVPVAPSRKR